ncbi:MAG: hypothetical protein M0Z77_00985 [Thermoplasmatales archaeon]|nr:hypothetical protein [Thermoplasmatales archaeon]
MTGKRTRGVVRSVTEGELSMIISRESSRTRIVPMFIFIRMDALQGKECASG